MQRALPVANTIIGFEIPTVNIPTIIARTDRVPSNAFAMNHLRDEDAAPERLKLSNRFMPAIDYREFSIEHMGLLFRGQCCMCVVWTSTTGSGILMSLDRLKLFLGAHLPLYCVVAIAVRGSNGSPIGARC